jgi:hypothetical protein
MARAIEDEQAAEDDAKQAERSRIGLHVAQPDPAAGTFRAAREKPQVAEHERSHAA